jgi:hypothetical protein
VIDAYVAKGQNPRVLLDQISELISRTPHPGGGKR